MMGFAAAQNAVRLAMLFMAHPKLSAQNINRADTLGLAPLHLACAIGSLTAVKRLVALGADVNAALGPARPLPNYIPRITVDGTWFVSDATPLTIALRAHCGE